MIQLNIQGSQISMLISIKISFWNVPNECRRKLLRFRMRSVWVYWGGRERFLRSKWHLNSAFGVQIIYLVLFTLADSRALPPGWFVSTDLPIGEDAGSVNRSLPAMASHQPLPQWSSPGEILSPALLPNLLKDFTMDLSCVFLTVVI